MSWLPLFSRRSGKVAPGQGGDAPGKKGFRLGIIQILVAVVIVGLIGAAAGSSFVYYHFPELKKLAGVFHRDPTQILGEALDNVEGGIHPNRIYWQSLPSVLHEMEVARIPIGDFSGGGGGIDEIDGNILFATPKGHIGYLSRDHELRSLGIRTPMNIQGILDHPVMQDPTFRFNWFRTHDIFVVRTSGDEFDLYASHHRYEDDCVRFMVSKIAMKASPQEIVVVGDDWETVFVAEPCIPFREEDPALLFNFAFLGLQAGGRFIRYDDDTLLISAGDHAMDGTIYPQKVSQDPSSHLGKILKYDLKTGGLEIFAMGVRNPQGLALSSDGQVWETEHGPLGGDELNLIREGGNYGWPEATLGMQYGFLDPWPSSTVPGRHNRYLKPKFSWVPSIAPSQLIQVDNREFPLWDKDLLVGTLKNQSFYRFRLNGDTIISSEIIPFGARIRDVMTLADGRLAVMTDSAKIVLVRNARKNYSDRFLEVRGSASMPDELQGLNAPIEVAMETPERLFEQHCGSCHMTEPVANVGPHLDHIVGRDIASLEDFGYSEALAKADGVWTEDRLKEFIRDPDEEFPGAAMPPVDITPEQADEIVEYLATLGD